MGNVSNVLCHILWTAKVYSENQAIGCRYVTWKHLYRNNNRAYIWVRELHSLIRTGFGTSNISKIYTDEFCITCVALSPIKSCTSEPIVSSIHPLTHSYFLGKRAYNFLIVRSRYYSSPLTESKLFLWLVFSLSLLFILIFSLGGDKRSLNQLCVHQEANEYAL